MARAYLIQTVPSMRQRISKLLGLVLKYRSDLPRLYSRKPFDEFIDSGSSCEVFI